MNPFYCALGSVLLLVVPMLSVTAHAAPAPDTGGVLQPEDFKHYVDGFNAGDHELYPSTIANADAWPFLRDNIPLFDCPDQTLEEIYYFRWWTYRKHIRQTPDGSVVTEFLPDVGWAGKDNTINCAAALHFYEGRWLADPQYLNDYARFWLRGGGAVRSYSFWIADALWNRYLVTGDAAEIKDLLPDLEANYAAWERTHLGPDGLFTQIDDRDGMEMSISGDGYRPTINSYMYADARAIANIAELAGQPDVAATYRAKAAAIKQVVQAKLWDPRDQFFKVLSAAPGAQVSPTRELIGYTPWYVNLPDPGFEAAWKELLDPAGFYAPYGPTTAEQRAPKFELSYTGHECKWNGPSWPYSTSITLTALANLLDNYQQNVITKADYVKLLTIYAASQHLKLDDGRTVPWIDENLNPLTGDWMARTILRAGPNPIPERGKDYNHSTFCDLIISGLIGLRPRADNVVEVNPLVPDGTWDYFCLDRVPYHRRKLTILYDKTGTRYHRGSGLRIFADGVEIGAAPTLTKMTANLPTAAAPTPPLSDTAPGWVKYAGNPVMGGEYGTCFDISVLKEAPGYRMWLSWRPKSAIALVTSPDGLSWSGSPVVVLGPRPETGWEDNINRPVVVKREDGYHLWYTGQTGAHSAIGYATSPDGLTWTRQSATPVLKPDQPWEKVAVMCPDVTWDADAKIYKMWYSGGDQYEPDAIGYATSPDGLHWTKFAQNPIFEPDPKSPWEQHKVTACQVIPDRDGYTMLYIGFENVQHAQIGLAHSKDGITGWVRDPANPIIRTSPRDSANDWDSNACYKPYAVFDGTKWLLWYNGRHGNSATDGGGLEQIGVAIHEGEGLGF